MGGCKVSETKQAVQEAVQANEVEEVKEKTIPITVLSGFLGAGKTTLLRHLLTAAGDKKIACIVNDVAALNIDSALVKSNIKQQSEELVELQNGCVCCTLRADLVKAVADMAKQGSFDVVVIECTGMAEPMQVAASFLMALAVNEEDGDEAMAEADGNAAGEEAEEKQEAGGLEAQLPSLDGLARLDTLVTVIDSSSFLDVIERSGNSFALDDGTGNPMLPMSDMPDDEAEGDKPEENEEKKEEQEEEEEGGAEDAVIEDGGTYQEPKLIIDLMVEQVEFADVILLNKTDLVTKKTLEQVRQAVAALNPGANIVESFQSTVDPSLVLHTGRFDPVKTSEGVGWLRALRETKEFGVNSFVYRRRRPFHPKRFYELLQSSFFVDTDWESRQGHGHSHDSDDEHDHDHDHGHAHSHGHPKEETPGDEEEEVEEIDLEAREKEIREAVARKKTGIFANVLRSKGFLWIATRPDMKGSWGHAGAVLRLDPEFPWACIFWPFSEEQEPDEDPDITALRAEVKEQKHGDRKQELVFIGILPEEQQKVITEALDKCLVTDDEWKDISLLVPEDPITMWQENPFPNWDAHVEKEDA